MRHFVPASALLLTAACATTPTSAPVAPAPTVVAAKPQRGGLIGLNPTEVGARFGRPRLQVREGDGTKIQFATPRCVLDLYLYPAGSGGVAKVTHVDARTTDGRDTDQARCIADLEAR